MMLPVLQVANSAAVGLFGMVLSRSARLNGSGEMC